MPKSGQMSASIASVEQGDAPARPLSEEHSSQLKALFEEHADSLRRYIAGRFGVGPPEPDEVAQAAFAKFAAHADVSAISNPRGYLYTIACNIVLDHRRRQTTRDVVHHELSVSNREDNLSDLHPERVLLAKEQFAVFEAALKKMPAMRRRIFLMVRAEGLTAAAVARRFAISESAVHKHVSRALADCAAAFARFNRQSGERP